MLCFAVAVAAAAAAKGLREAPKIEPPFESIIEEGAGPVREFALRDHRGALHTMASWSTHRAIVLLFCKTADRDSMEARRATAKLAAFFQQRGVLFLAVCCDGTTATAAAHDLASEVQSALPILFDPQQVVARQAGVRVVPEAVLLSPDGQVLYRGRVQAARGVPEALESAAGSYDLESALRAIDRDELPAVTRAPAAGNPLSSVARPAEARPEETMPITFTQHVAPIIWSKCARCHRPREVAPFSLLTYEDAAKRATFIHELTEDDRMPPWKPHPGAGVFLDAPRLSVIEKETLARWAATGCARRSRQSSGGAGIPRRVAAG